MKIGVLGTGTVGQTIAARLAEAGHQVGLGGRSAESDAAAGWAARTGNNARTGTFHDIAAFGELVINCTLGTASLAALDMAGAQNLDGKVLLDVANPLVFGADRSVTLSVCNDDSLAEQIQRGYPAARVVKGLNTVSAQVMPHPEAIPGDHVLPICGNDADAKVKVRGLLHDMGWPDGRIIDLGDLAAARSTEAYFLFWFRLMSTLGTPRFNITVAR
jgi:predicted dinucleotide-binding enzyme